MLTLLSLGQVDPSELLQSSDPRILEWAESALGRDPGADLTEPSLEHLARLLTPPSVRDAVVFTAKIGAVHRRVGSRRRWAWAAMLGLRVAWEPILFGRTGGGPPPGSERTRREACREVQSLRPEGILSERLRTARLGALQCGGAA